jgi:hypothetical protein
MSTQSPWGREAAYLAREWQPLFIREVMHYYATRNAILNSDRAAFLDVYERYFLNPDKEDSHR